MSLAPVLLAQGYHVRRITPRLPEAAGPREGQIGRGLPLRLLIAGDSAAAGVGAEHQDDALSGHLTQALAEHFLVNWTLWARTGDTAAELLERIHSTPENRFDVAVISIGVNDVTANRTVQRWLRLLDQIIVSLQQRHRLSHILFSSLPPMQHFPALPQPLRWYLGQRAARYNLALAAHLRGYECVHVAPPEYPDDATLIATDGFHPGPGAYAHWGRQLAAQLCQCTDWGERLAD